MKLSSQDTILFLDTSAPVACVGIWSENRVCAELQIGETRRHAELLPDALENVLSMAERDFSSLAAVVVGKGPGSFVGLRVAMATAKGIALARGVPLFGLETLVCLAGLEGVPEGEGVALLDARRGEVYAQRVRRWGERTAAIEAPVAISPASLEAYFSWPRFCVGNGVALLARVPSDCVAIEVAGPNVAGMARAFWTRHDAGELIRDERDELIPSYCRAPDAKLPEIR